MTLREESSGDGVERFPLPEATERWLEFLALEHAVLPLPADFARIGEEFLVSRDRVTGRAIAAGRIPKDHAAPLFLQAAAVASFLQASGLWLDEEDLSEAAWDIAGGTPRLWLTKSPAALRRRGPGPAICAVLAGFLDRLFARGRRIAHPQARGLFDRLLSTDAAYRRAEFWLSDALRAFPELASQPSAGARARTLGSAGGYLRSAAVRARLEKGRAILSSRAPRVFRSECSSLTPGGALGLAESPASISHAARALRERHARESEGRRAVWIAVEPERWDVLSRRAFETASRALDDEVETLSVPADLPPPLLPDEWRREVFVPCGTLNASLRFYERFAELAREDPSGAWRQAEAIVASPGWAAFVADPTGDAPLPSLEASSSIPVSTGALEDQLLEALSVLEGVAAGDPARLFPRRNLGPYLTRLELAGQVERVNGAGWRLTPRARGEIRLSGSRREETCRRWASVEEDPGRRIELWLAGAEPEEAMAEAQRWLLACPRGPAEKSEKWFGLSALLAAAARPETLPAWLEALEAEREIAGGRPEEAEKRLARIADLPGAAPVEARAAKLRLAEVTARRGRCEAGRQAAAWRRAFPDAPAQEQLRAIVLEAGSRARQGEHEAALALLDEADRIGGSLPVAERLEAALARAAVYSSAGRFREEQETYDLWRPIVLEARDDLLAAQLLSHEALGLADRREFTRAVARLEEALAVARDDPVERARLSIDLASTLYHSGRGSRCRKLLDEAIALAGSAGREDVARIARANRLELLINGGEWAEASEEVEKLLSRARAESDDTRLLVALHHRGRLALRRGLLGQAQRDNAEARALAQKVSDRLETGELWLEEGDRLLYEGDIDSARRAYEAAAADPPDRCDSAATARDRMAELAWAAASRPPDCALEGLRTLFERDEYLAAETVARWHVLLQGKTSLPADSISRAERALRARGGAALADRVFGRGNAGMTPPSPPLAVESLRRLRTAVAGALAGEESEAPLEALGLTGLSLRNGDGREIVRLGEVAEEAARRRLEAGAANYEMSLWPDLPEEETAAVTLLLETLLFRFAPPPPPSDFAQGWRRLGVTAGDASMEEPYRRLIHFAPQPVTVLVLGESGSGKEAVARAVHSLSPRASGPFVAVNVPAIPPALLESELFGHARGAFTGADRDRKGLLEEAERGTVFFDEVGDLTLPLQAKLLRALQEREIRRVGENRPRRLDVRVVSATSRNLEREVEAGRFREDLYYRLHVAVIALPPLRDRGRDTQLLARHFLARYGQEYGHGDLAFAPAALAALSAHSWPGNVRELQNVVAQAAALADAGGVIAPDLLPEPLRRQRRGSGIGENYRARVDEHRRDLIAEALRRSGGNRSRAARDLGLSRQALLYLIRELNVSVRQRPFH